jgi:hypothetical protein
VLFEFEVREATDPVNAANFKFGTLAKRPVKLSRRQPDPPQIGNNFAFFGLELSGPFAH